VLSDQPFQVALGSGAAEVVKHGYHPAVLDHPHCRVDSEEPGAASDEDPSRRPAFGCARGSRPGSRRESGIGAKCGGRHGGSLP
jgi:hypothetical protein